MGWKDRVAVLAAALWWGSLTAIGAIAVPLLFANLPSASMAGQMAAKLFTAQAWTSMGCGVLLLIAARSSEPVRMDWGRGSLAYVITGLLMALLVEFAVAPHVVARQNLRLWHTVGSAMFAVQWVCALVVLWKLASPPQRVSCRA